LIEDGLFEDSIPVRTRFAPSPTGFLHIGGARTGLFEWLTAKASNGTVILRIDDTDQQRLVPGAIAAIINGLHWLGIPFDEGPSTEEIARVDPGSEQVGIGGNYGPYIQSLRLERYREVADLLVRGGHAYRCDCSPERLQKEREEQAHRKEPPGYSGYCRDRNVPASVPHVIRFRMDNQTTVSLNDLIKGIITWENPALRDTVILKSDGFPTYHLATVVDDHDMEISHVLRADEWISTTPVHLRIFEALNWNVPHIGHLPPVLGKDGKKLSKRHGATFVSTYEQEGYLPEAVLNFVSLIGWSPGEGSEREIFTLDELRNLFSLSHVNRSGGVFNLEKLQWMNGMYIRMDPVARLAQRIKPFLVQAGLKVDDSKLLRITPHIQERLVVLKDAVDLTDFLFHERIFAPEQEIIAAAGSVERAREMLDSCSEQLSSLERFDAPEIEAALRGLLPRFDSSPKKLFMLIRVALTARKVTPPLFESIPILGKETTLRRLADARSGLR
jgi:glutamyl-tRNA synthetase